MKLPDLKDPNDWLYALCSIITAVLILATSVICLGYLIVLAPSDAHVLDEGEEAVGSWLLILCAAIFLICLALVIRDFVRRMKGCPREERIPRYMGTAMGHSGVLFAVTAVFTIIVIGFSNLIGEAISENFIEKMSDYEIIASMLIAGPTEEIPFRMLMIGLPMVVVCAVMHRASIKDIMGGFGMSWAAFVFLIISSVAFGLVHLDGWSFMKFPDTFITGLLFGYVYIEYGLHITIVVHSAFDMMSSLEVILGEFGEIPMLATMVLGGILLIRLCFKAKSYKPVRKVHEPFDGGLLEMWDSK